jgi:aminobenzoyl-glutamate utilization protein B
VHICLATGLLFAQKSKNKISSSESCRCIKNTSHSGYSTGYTGYKNVALQIWNYAEVGYKETKSSTLLQQTLKDAGFAVEAGVAEIPTAFVAMMVLVNL